MAFEVSKNAWSYLNNILEKFSDIFEKSKHKNPLSGGCLQEEESLKSP